MMRVLSIAILLLVATTLSAQEKKKIYDPAIDGMQQLDEAVLKAGESGKHVLVQVGGNWCPWCIRFHDFIGATHSVDSIIKADYVFVLLNYSKESKNLKALERLGYPQRFGFPVLVVLDSKGNRLHIQDSGFLEKDKNYSEEKVMTFLKCWNAKAVDPKTYQE